MINGISQPSDSRLCLLPRSLAGGGNSHITVSRHIGQAPRPTVAYGCLLYHRMMPRQQFLNPVLFVAVDDSGERAG